MNEQYLEEFAPLLAQYAEELEPLEKKYPLYKEPSEGKQYRQFCILARPAWQRLCDRVRDLQDKLKEKNGKQAS